MFLIGLPSMLKVIHLSLSFPIRLLLVLFSFCRAYQCSRLCIFSVSFDSQRNESVFRKELGRPFFFYLLLPSADLLLASDETDDIVFQGPLVGSLWPDSPNYKPIPPGYIIPGGIKTGIQVRESANILRRQA